MNELKSRGVDTIVDDAKVTSIVFKGATISLLTSTSGVALAGVVLATRS